MTRPRPSIPPPPTRTATVAVDFIPLSCHTCADPIDPGVKYLRVTDYVDGTRRRLSLCAWCARRLGSTAGIVEERWEAG